MHSSLCHHVKLTIPSAAVVLGTTEGELYAHFNNYPPERLTLAEIDAINIKRLKSGKCDDIWFNSERAMKEPLLAHSLETLCHMLLQSLTSTNITSESKELIDIFRINSPTNLNLGGILGALRIVHTQYTLLTGELYILLDRLSDRGFFKLV